VLTPRDEWVDSASTYELLDELMEQIPGRDGFGAFLNETFDGTFETDSLLD
jgi:hypothetical protein